MLTIRCFCLYISWGPLCCKFLSMTLCVLPQTVFQAIPLFLCPLSTFLLKTSLLPFTCLLHYHSLFLEHCLSGCLSSHYIQYRPVNSSAHSSTPVFRTCVCQYILTHGLMKIWMLWETRWRGRTEWEPELCSTSQVSGSKQRQGRAEWVRAEALPQLWPGSRVSKPRDKDLRLGFRSSDQDAPEEECDGESPELPLRASWCVRSALWWGQGPEVRVL